MGSRININSGYNVPKAERYIIEKDSTVIIGENGVLRVDGAIVNYGTLINKGRIYLNRSVEKLTSSNQLGSYDAGLEHPSIIVFKNGNCSNARGLFYNIQSSSGGLGLFENYGTIVELYDDKFIGEGEYSSINVEALFPADKLLRFGAASGNYLLRKGEDFFYIENGLLKRNNPKDVITREYVEICTTDRKYCVVFKITSIVDRNGHICGDPYIQTIKGEIYKLANFEGYSRMLEGYIDNKEIFINAYTKKNTPEEAKYAEEWTKTNMLKYLPKEQWQEWGRFDFTKECFINKLWVKYGDKECVINTDDLNVDGNFEISMNEEVISFPTFTDTSNRNIEIILSNKLSLIVSNYENPQIKSSLKLITNNNKFEHLNGAIVYKMYQEDIEIEEFKSTKLISYRNDRDPLDIKLEVYLSSDSQYKEVERILIY